MNLVSLQFITSEDYNQNLSKLEELIKKAPKDSFILAPELCLNGYAYDRLDEALSISAHAIPRLKELSLDKTIALTLTTKSPRKHLNTLYIFHKVQILHTQSKHELFVMNEEKKHFKAGDIEDIKIVKVGDLKVACLICFEIRFPKLWERIKGADIILVPAMWGELRKDHYEALTKALAISNQCFVIASDSANKECAKGSGIITPFGEEYRDDDKEFLIKDVDLNEIKKMRRYLNVGIKS
jgi:omega-amidase